MYAYILDVFLRKSSDSFHFAAADVQTEQSGGALTHGKEEIGGGGSRKRGGVDCC